MKSIVVLAFLVSLVVAHDVMITPVQRNGATTPNTGTGNQKPCGDNNNTPVKKTYQTVPGIPFQIKWQHNHQGNTVTMSLASPAGQTPSNFVNFSTVSYDTNPGTVTIPTSYQPGLYTMQWYWAGWYACVDVQILYAPPAGSTLSTGTIYNLASGHGTFDASTGTISCNSGYTKQTKGGVLGCYKGVTPAIGFAIFIVVLAVVVIAIAGTLYYLKNNKPETYVSVTTPFKNGFAKFKSLF